MFPKKCNALVIETQKTGRASNCAMAALDEEETRRLLHRGDVLLTEDPVPVPASVKKRAAAGVAALFLVAVAGAVVARSGDSVIMLISQSSKKKGSSAADTQDGIAKTEAALVQSTTEVEGVSVQNKYIAAEGPEARPALYPWLNGRMVLEPFHAATFSVVPKEGQKDHLASEYSWIVERPTKEQNKFELDLKASRRRLLTQKGLSLRQINEKEPEYDDGVVVRASGKSLRHTFDELGLHRLTVGPSEAAKADVDKPANPTVVEFYVKYVRRELHSIDEEDREKVRGVMIAATFLRASVN